MSKVQKNNLETEIPHWDFKLQRKKAKENWNKELAKIEVGEGKQKDDRSIFYTALYHTMIAPNVYSDVDGRNRGHDQKIHQSSNKQYTVFFHCGILSGHCILCSILLKKNAVMK